MVIQFWPPPLSLSTPCSLLGLVQSLYLGQCFVLRLPDEELDKDHSGDAAAGKEEECTGSAEVVVADEVQLGRDEVSDPPEH